MQQKEFFAFSDVFLHDFYGEGATYDYFEKLVTRGHDGQTVEVMCHPGYLDHEILSGSSYAEDRVRETDILTSIKLPEGIVLIQKAVNTRNRFENGYG